jgi:hypothetical protein
MNVFQSTLWSTDERIREYLNASEGCWAKPSQGWLEAAEFAGPSTLARGRQRGCAVEGVADRVASLPDWPIVSVRPQSGRHGCTQRGRYVFSGTVLSSISPLRSLLFYHFIRLDLILQFLYVIDHAFRCEGD